MQNEKRSLDQILLGIAEKLGFTESQDMITLRQRIMDPTNTDKIRNTLYTSWDDYAMELTEQVSPDMIEKARLGRDAIKGGMIPFIKSNQDAEDHLEDLQDALDAAGLPELADEIEYALELLMK